MRLGNESRVDGVCRYMGPDRLRLLLAAPVASLFLVLSLCAFLLQRSSSVGMGVPLPKVRLDYVSDCNYLSDRSIVVQLRRDGSTWINETRESSEELGATLTKIYDYRAERTIYMISDPDVSFGEFANFYNAVDSSTSGLHIVLRTRTFDEELNQCPEGISCGLDWPDGSYQPCVSRDIGLRPVAAVRRTSR